MVLQRLYDSEINVTLTTLWDDGFDFALISYMEWEEAGKPIDMKSFISVEPRERPNRADPWHNVTSADKLAAAIHDAAVGKYPDSDYAKLYGQLGLSPRHRTPCRLPCATRPPLPKTLSRSAEESQNGGACSAFAL